MSNVLKITKDDLDKNNIYVGDADVTNFSGSIEIEANLGCVKFTTSVRASNHILAKAGSGIEAGLGIEAGSCIKAGSGIKAGWGIEAGSGIEAGYGIKAGYGIEAGSGIKAGSGIEAGLGIVSKTISSGVRIFAGLCIWRLPENHEMEIRAKLLKGEIAFGTLVEPEATSVDQPPLTPNELIEIRKLITEAA